MLGRVLLVAALLFVKPIRAAESDFQEWTWLIFQGPSAERVRGYFEVQPRFGSNWGRLETILVRPAVSYALSEQSSVWLGYAWTPSFNPRFNDEQRLWQQYLYQLPLAGGTWVSRTRVEQRWIQGTPSTAFRLRQLLRAQWLLGAADSDLALIVWDEIFFHLGSASPAIQAGYNQNRFFVGIGKTLYPQIRGEAGYLLNHVARPGATPDRLNHVLLTALIVTL